jgi:hypothetical protein
MRMHFKITVLALGMYSSLTYGIDAPEAAIQTAIQCAVKLKNVKASSKSEWISYQPNKVFVGQNLLVGKADNIVTDKNSSINHFLIRQDQFIELAVYAARKAGVASNQFRVVDDGFIRKFELSSHISDPARLKFEEDFTAATNYDLSNPREALAERTNPVKMGVDPEVAAAACQSGYNSKELLLKGLDDPKLFEYISYVWGPQYQPLNYNQVTGVATLSVNEATFNNVNSIRMEKYDSATRRVLLRAIKNPMKPFQTAGGAWVVHYWQEYRLHNYNNGSMYTFIIFKSRDAAEKFANTHRAVFVDDHNTKISTQETLSLPSK